MTSPTGSVTSNPFASSASSGGPPSAHTLVLLNIHNHVPVVLTMDDGNFRQWRSFFELTFNKFDLVNHVDGTIDAAAMIDDPEWLQVDACIVQWLYSTVSKDIWSDVYSPRTIAYSAWTAITGQFLDNSLQRAVYIQQEFHSLFQGDMSVAEYCGRLKRLADNLYDCGAAISDTALVINTLRGMNNKFSQAIAVLSTMKPPPTFLYTKSYLLQEEHRIKHSLQMEAQTALLAARDVPARDFPPKSAPVSNITNPSPAPSNNAGGGDRRKKRKADNRPRPPASSTNSAGGNSSTPPPPWAAPPNAWQGMVQAWPMHTWRPSVLAPRPGAPTPAAMTAFTAPAPQPDPGTLPPGLYSALHGMSLNSTPGNANDWFLDTGASSHMASHPGILTTSSPSPVARHIIVGNGGLLTARSIGRTSIPTSSTPLHLHNVLIAPHLVKNLISVRALTRDNSVSVEFGSSLGFHC